MQNNYALIIVSIAIITVLSLAVAYKCVSSKRKELFQNSPVRICLFYASWCPHCEKYLSHPAKPFDKAGDLASKNLNGVVFEKIDYEQNKNLASKYDVNSFPSIIAISSDGKKISDFEGNRMNPDELVAFAKQAVKAN
jgi:thiol-disulfide isomerase/thioredoxin